jgi:hypothetical protein
MTRRVGSQLTTPAKLTPLQSPSGRNWMSLMPRLRLRPQLTSMSTPHGLAAIPAIVVPDQNELSPKITMLTISNGSDEEGTRTIWVNPELTRLAVHTVGNTPRSLTPGSIAMAVVMLALAEIGTGRRHRAGNRTDSNHEMSVDVTSVSSQGLSLTAARARCWELVR